MNRRSLHHAHAALRWLERCELVRSRSERLCGADSLAATRAFQREEWAQVAFLVAGGRWMGKGAL